MGIYQGRDLKKPSGGRRRHPYKVKRKMLHGRFFTETRLAETQLVITERVRGGNLKLRAKKVTHAVVIDKSKGTARKEKILKVLETPANKEYARRNIITKGTIVEVESGRAVVVSRPGQDGVVNVILLK